MFRIRTTDQTFAGSGNAHTVQLASDAWNEKNLAWNKCAALPGSPFGAIATGTLPNSIYDALLAVDAVQPLVGKQGTLAITSTGTHDLSGPPTRRRPATGPS